MHKYKNIFLLVNFNDCFKTIDKVYNHLTKSSKTNFFLPRFHSDYGHKSLAYQGSRLCNKIPNDLKDHSHHGKFHVKLKDILLKHK